jgi:hypothetical protein
LYTNGPDAIAIVVGAALGASAGYLIARLLMRAMTGRGTWGAAWTLSGAAAGAVVAVLQVPVEAWPAFSVTGILAWVLLLAGAGRIFGPRLPGGEISN